MPSVKLTDRYIKSLSCPENQTRLDVQDGLIKALSVHVTPKGRKSFSVRYKYGSQRKRMSLGEYGPLAHQTSLVKAREKASHALLLLQSGKDPAVVARQKARPTPAQNSFQKMAKIHFEQLRKKGRSESYIRNMEYSFEKHVYPRMGRKSIDMITKADVLSALSELYENGHTTSFNRLLTAIRPVFAMVEIPDPSARIEKYPEKTNDAWFTLDQIARIWIALDSNEAQVHPMTSLAVKMSILTLKRAREISGARFEEFDYDVWRIPKERMKGRRLEVVPYTKQMKKIVEAARNHPRRPQITTDSPFVFSSTHVQDAPIESTAMSRAFPRTRRAANLDNHQGTLHSLRHSGATILASKKTSPYVVSALLSHQMSASGVAKVTSRYNMYDLLDERRDALKKWNKLVMKAVKRRRASIDPVALSEDPLQVHLDHAQYVDEHL